MRNLFRKKHELWLKVLYSAFSLPKGEMFDILYDFSLIEFRHLKWIAKEIIKNRDDIDFDRENIKIKYNNLYEIVDTLIKEFKEIEKFYKNSPLFDRIKNDEKYMIEKIESFKKYKNIKIDSFNQSKKIKDKKLSKESLDALIIFLFEESYKEYELILVYFYLSLKTDDSRLYSIYEDLIYESMFHLKSFAYIQGKLGLLNIPRTVMKEVYRFDNLNEFLIKGIEEEKGAKEECKALAAAIKDEELSKFFEFINFQEDFHITLMQEAISYLKD